MDYESRCSTCCLRRVSGLIASPTDADGRGFCRLTYFIRLQLSGKISAAVTQPHNWCLRLIAYCLPWRSGKNVSFIRDVFRSRIGRNASVDDTFRNTIQSALSSHIKHSSIGFKEALNYTDDKYFPWPALYRSPR